MRITDCFLDNQEEIRHKDGCQHWHKLILSDLGRKHSEAVIIPHRTWSEPYLDPKPNWPKETKEDADNSEYADYVSVANRQRVARRAKRAIRFACKTAEFDRMITLTTKDNFTREEMERKASKFIRLYERRNDRPRIPGDGQYEPGATRI